jgi:hypothetical protein
MRCVTRTSSYRPVEERLIESYDPLLVKKNRRSNNSDDDEFDEDEPVRRFLFWWLTFWKPRYRRSYRVMGESKDASAATAKASLDVTALLSDDEFSFELSQLPWPSAFLRAEPSPPDSDHASLSATFWEELQQEQAAASTSRVKTQYIFVSKEAYTTSWWKRLFQRLGRSRRHARKERAVSAGQRDSNSTTESTEDGLSPDQDGEILPSRSAGHFSVTPSSPRRSWLPPRIRSDPRDDAIEVEWSGKGIAAALQQYLEQEDSKVRPDFDDIHPGDSKSIGSAILAVSFENHEACAQLIFKGEDSEDDDEDDDDDYLFLFPPEPLGVKFSHPSASSNSQAYNYRQQTEQCDWVNDTIDGAWRQFDDLAEVHDPTLEMVPSPPPMDDNGSITDYEGALGWSFSRDDASFSSILSASRVFTPICRHSGQGSDPLFVPPSYYCTTPALLDQDDEGVEVCLRLPREIVRPLATPSEVSSLAPPSLFSLS